MFSMYPNLSGAKTKGVLDMCKASLEAKRTMPAVVGQTYAIGITDHGLGALHPTTEDAAKCVVCVKDGTKLTLSNIPDALQLRFGITDHEVATFKDYGDNYHDLLHFENGENGLVCEFADAGVIAYVGVLDIAAAITGADRPYAQQADLVLEPA